MDSAVPQAAAIGSPLRSASPCKGLSEANSVVVRLSLSPETIGLVPFPRGRAKPPIHFLRVVWERNGVEPKFGLTFPLELYPNPLRHDSRLGDRMQNEFLYPPIQEFRYE
jgi:hypothetical protein